MRRKSTLAILACLALSVRAIAQEPAEDSKENKSHERKPQSKRPGEKDKDNEAAPVEKPLEKTPIVLDGDKLYMKDGTIVAGGQIVRQSPRGYEFAIVEGVDPFLIPLRQVDHVEYDEIDPLAERRQKAMAPEPNPPNVISMENLSPEFAQSLAKQLPEDALSAAEGDFVPVLQGLAGKLGVKLVIDDAVRAISPKDRLWSYTAPPQTSFSALLEQAFVPKMPAFAVRYDVDKVIIMLKPAETQADTAPPATQDANAAKPGAIE